MNELVQSFFANGFDSDIQECVILYLETIKSIVLECEKEELLAVYLIDHINNTTYNIESIRSKCTAIKQIHLFSTFSQQDPTIVPDSSPVKETSDIFTEEYYMQPTVRP